MNPYRALIVTVTSLALVSVATAREPGINVEKAEIGDMLLAPYYTTESGNETYLNVVNTTDRFKALKVRFREARASEDSLDFHVYMSPKDMWTATLTQDANGDPVLVTGDESCTFGRVGDSADSSGARVQTTYIDQVTDRLSEAGAEYTGPEPAQRIREGYVEIIEMGTFSEELREEVAADPVTVSGAEDFVTRAATTDSTADDWLGYYAKHVDGQPRDCRAFEALNTELDELDPETIQLALIEGGTPSFTFDPPDGEPREVKTGFGYRTGGLFGSSAIINVEDATYTPVDLTILNTLDEFCSTDNMFFSQSPATGEHLDVYTMDTGLSLNKDTLQYWDLPDLSSHGFSWRDDGGYSARRAWSVSSALATTTLFNEFFVDPALGAETDWVVTQPTKRFFVTGDSVNGDGVAENTWLDRGPWEQRDIDIDPIFFTRNYDYAEARSCEPMRIRSWDREEEEILFTADPSDGFSPGVPDTPESQGICYETTVFTFSRSDSDSVTAPSPVLGAQVSLTGIAIGTDAPAGWTRMDLTNGTAGDTSARQRNAYDANTFGLPVIGFAAWRFYNDGQTSAGSLNQYGGGFRHRLVQPDNIPQGLSLGER